MRDGCRANLILFLQTVLLVLSLVTVTSKKISFRCSSDSSHDEGGKKCLISTQAT